MEKNIRVRFAPSPTGGLHLGGVRTALFNYLFARQHGGTFVLRIEDTDQSRFVPGAESYIQECLKWCGIEPDESPQHEGAFGPYRQSERKDTYRAFAEQLVANGYAYYAFDTPEELEVYRQKYPNFTYSQANRLELRNSLSLSPEETKSLLEAGAPHVIRIKTPADQTVGFQDMIRGMVSFDTSQVDDKVLLKADGMPTYHLAVVVDDYRMKITHVFRGEEWLPSAPIHILLWKYLGWESDMPQWGHLPLILKPDGHGKLSKRDGDRLGFPVYAMNWQDPQTGELSTGFRERGFLPEAFVNMLAVLGWNDGTEQELFTLEELISKFSVERISKAGAKFDYEKAKWFNHHWLQRVEADAVLPTLEHMLIGQGLQAPERPYLKAVWEMVKERMTLLPDFLEQALFFFQRPSTYDLDAVQKKWTPEKTLFFNDIIGRLGSIEPWSSAELEHFYKHAIEASGMKMGELMLPLRIMLVGGKFGPHVFDILATLGREESIVRIQNGLTAILTETEA